jgi:hypothetical protein
MSNRQLAVSTVTITLVALLAVVFIIGGLVLGMVFALTGWKGVQSVFQSPATAPATQCPEGDAWVPSGDFASDLDDKQRWRGGRMELR